MRPVALRGFVSALLALVALATSGCASMSKDECLAMDRKACAKYGVRSDLDLYQAGRAQGLREYCKPANGYRLGSNGASYDGVCPADLERDFLSAYDAGQQFYTLQARVSDARAQLGAKRRELDRVQHGI